MEYCGMHTPEGPAMCSGVETSTGQKCVWCSGVNACVNEDTFEKLVVCT